MKPMLAVLVYLQGTAENIGKINYRPAVGQIVLPRVQHRSRAVPSVNRVLLCIGVICPRKRFAEICGNFLFQL